MAGPNEFSLRGESDTLRRVRLITPLRIDILGHLFRDPMRGLQSNRTRNL